jgi:hypothetical protein
LPEGAILRAQSHRRLLSPGDLMRSNAVGVAHLQPASRRPCEPVAGARHLQATKWFIPGGLGFASGFGSSPEGIFKRLILVPRQRRLGDASKSWQRHPGTPLQSSVLLYGVFLQKGSPYL